VEHDRRTYWRSPEALDGPAAEPAHPLHTPERFANRRDFLKAAGFTIAGAAVSSCSRAPEQRAMPFVEQPDDLVPGRSYYQTSVCGGCSAGCGVLVQTRDGRPLKLEGNPGHPLSRGGLCAVGQAATLGLYDAQRLTAPRMDGDTSTWAAVDQAILAEMAAIRADGGAVRVLTGTLVSPSLLDVVRRFVATFSDAVHLQWDPLPGSATLEAHLRTHGVRAQPRLRLERADVIAAFDADFLGTWQSPVQFAAGYRDGRTLDAAPRRFSHHVQVESRLSLTGARADRRIRLAPHAVTTLLHAVASRLGELAGGETVLPPPDMDAGIEAAAADLADRLWGARGRSVVLCGTNDEHAQTVVNYANHLLGAYDGVLDLAAPSRQVQGDDGAVDRLLEEVAQGHVAALIVAGVNPVHQHHRGAELARALSRVPLTISLAPRLNETAAATRFVCPDAHPLEAWGDAEPVAGILSIQQPAIHPLGDTRPAIETFSVWAGEGAAAQDLVRAYWETAVFPRQSDHDEFLGLWTAALRDGVVAVSHEIVPPSPFDSAAVRAPAVEAPPAGHFSLVLYPKVAMLDGSHAYNAWLHELPDPVSKVVWDNYASLSLAAARSLNVATGDMVRIEADGVEAIELPVFVQPGQDDSIVAVALGYGSVLSARFADLGPRWIGSRVERRASDLVGVNAAPFRPAGSGSTSRVVRVAPTGTRQKLASTQDHFRLEETGSVRQAMEDLPPLIHETTLAALDAGGDRGDADHGGHGTGHAEPGLWPDDHAHTGHRWGMVIDLASCTGCSACVIACQVENNTPVVGRDEVSRSREMHWLRLDRYYTGSDDAVEMAVQPMLCQHCGNAPCETVCPVVATVHSSDGLNVQVYNRCVGTRFCENNCPYKVRRFNWFEYAREQPIENLALNPDVTVRSRGVMEKCSFCMHRIQETELEAKRQGVPLADGLVQTACQQSCPSRAIRFGDLNDPDSAVSVAMADPRRYHVLETLNVRPAVGYLTSVRNREEL